MSDRARRSWTVPVQVSGRLSCGCRFAPSRPLPMSEANAYPGTVVICDRHDEYAVVVRVSTRLADECDAVAALLERSGLVDADTAAAIAAEQASAGRR